MTRATVSIYVTNRTLRSRILQMLFGLVSDSKRLQRWFASVVWTCRRLPKTRWTLLHSATTHAVSRRCVHIIGTSAVRSTMHSILVTKATSEILTDVNKIRPWGIFTSGLWHIVLIRCSPPLRSVDYFTTFTVYICIFFFPLIRCSLHSRLVGCAPLTDK